MSIASMCVFNCCIGLIGSKSAAGISIAAQSLKLKCAVMRVNGVSKRQKGTAYVTFVHHCLPIKSSELWALAFLFTIKVYYTKMLPTLTSSPPPDQFQ